MPNVASVLKEEIARIARKESKAFYNALPGALASLKKTVSAQKKKIAQLEAKVGKLEKALGAKDGLKVPKQEELEGSRLGAKNIAKLRAKLDLTRAEMAKLIGASTNSIFLWENGKATPRAAAKAKIIALRGLGKRELKKLLGDERKQPASATEASAANVPAPKKAAKRKPAKVARKKSIKAVSAPSSELPAAEAAEAKS